MPVIAPDGHQICSQKHGENRPSRLLRGKDLCHQKASYNTKPPEPSFCESDAESCDDRNSPARVGEMRKCFQSDYSDLLLLWLC